MLGPGISLNFFLSEEVTVNRFTRESASLNFLYNRDITLFPSYDRILKDRFAGDENATQGSKNPEEGQDLA